MGRQNIWETIMGLELQDPKDMVVFYAKDIVWSAIHRRDGTIDRVSKIASERFPTLLKGRK